MEFTGKVVGLNQDYSTGSYTISFLVNETKAVLSGYDAIKNMDKLDIKAVKHREKRSLDANAYYWKLLSQLAEVIKVSKSRAHNMMLRKYGQREFIDGKLVTIPIPDTDVAENTALEADTYHIKPTSQVKEGKDGTIYRTYVMMRGSSDYNTKEMSELIEGLVSECKEQGIETLAPAELEQMIKAWKP